MSQDEYSGETQCNFYEEGDTYSMGHHFLPPKSDDSMGKMVGGDTDFSYSLGVESQIRDINGNLPIKRHLSPDKHEVNVMDPEAFVPDSEDPADAWRSSFPRSAFKSNHIFESTKTIPEVSAPAVPDYTMMIDHVLVEENLKFVEGRVAELSICLNDSIRHANEVDSENAKLHKELQGITVELEATRKVLKAIRDQVDYVLEKK